MRRMAVITALLVSVVAAFGLLAPSVIAESPTPPVVNAGADQSAAEGQIVSVNATFADVPGETHTASIDWGDGSPPTTIDPAVSPISASHTYADNGTYTVAVSVTDNNGATGADSLVVSVSNIAPSFEAGPDRTIASGESLNLSIPFADPGVADLFTAQVDWGDGTGQITAPGTATSPVTGSKTYTAPNVYLVTVTVSDDDGGSAMDYFFLTVTAPGLTTSSGGVIIWDKQGSTAAMPAWQSGIHIIYGTETNPTKAASVTLANVTVVNAIEYRLYYATTAPGGTWQFYINGELVGSAPALFIGWPSGGPATWPHVITLSDRAALSLPWNPAGSNELKVKYVSSGGANAYVSRFEALLTYPVANTPPVVDAGPDKTVSEGSPVVVTASFSDSGYMEHHVAAFGWGDGHTDTVDPAVTPVTLSHMYATHGVYVVNVTVTDAAGAAASDSLTVTVSNIPPSVLAGPDQSVGEGQTVSVTATFSYPDMSDAFTAVIDWGDGSSQVGTLAAAGGSGTVTGSHVYASPGVYFAEVRVSDDDGGTGVDGFFATVQNWGFLPQQYQGVIWSHPGCPVPFPAWETGYPCGSDINPPQMSQSFTVASATAVDSLTFRMFYGTYAPTGIWKLYLNGVMIGTASTVQSASGQIGKATWPQTVSVNNLDLVNLAWNPTGSNMFTVELVRDPVNNYYVSRYEVVIGYRTPNDRPTVNAGPDRTVVEGDTVVVTASFTDPLTPTGHTALIDWGNGSVDVGSINYVYCPGTIYCPPGQLMSSTVSGARAYYIRGTYTVTVHVTDSVGATGSDTFLLTVGDAPPRVYNIPDQSGNEGQPVSFAVSFSDPSQVDTHHVTIVWGDGSTESFGPVGKWFMVSHVYGDNGSYGVTVTITDASGASGSDTLSVTIANLPPVVDAGGDLVTEEGQLVSLTVGFTDQGLLDTHSATVDWGDGVTADVSPAVSGFSIAHVYATNGTYPVVVSVLDDDGSAGADTVLVTVTNAAPVVNAGADIVVAEGGTATLAVSFTDASSSDSHTGIVSWGDGAVEALGVVTSPFSRSHVYVQNGSYVATVTITDSDGASAGDSVAVTVTNVLPAVDAGPDLSTDEGRSVTLTAEFEDAGILDAHTATVDWGDGNVESLGGVSGSFTLGHLYINDGAYTVTVIVTDTDGGVGQDTVLVTVLNVAPLVEEISNRSVVEGQTFTLIVTFADAGIEDVHTATIDWGGSVVESVGAVSSPFTVSHIYGDNGSYSVVVKVVDDAAGIGSTQLSIIVANAFPVVHIGEVAEVDEGQATSVEVAFTDAGTLDTHRASAIWGDGSVTPNLPVTSPFTLQHTYVDDGQYLVRITVTDDDGAATTAVVWATVNNVPPHISPIPDMVVELGQPVSFWVSFTDPNDYLEHRATWDWGDGTIQNGNGIGVTSPFRIGHLYTSVGTYTFSITINDGDGGVDTYSMTITVQRTVMPVVVTVANAEGYPYQVVVLQAAVRGADGLPPHGSHQVSFAIDGRSIGSGLMDTSGVAILSWLVGIVPTSFVEAHTITATFPGDDSYEPASGSGVFLLKSAQSLKQGAIQKLRSIETQHKLVDKTIQKAIEHIQASLNPALWVDASHLMFGQNNDWALALTAQFQTQGKTVQDDEIERGDFDGRVNGLRVFKEEAQAIATLQAHIKVYEAQIDALRKKIERDNARGRDTRDDQAKLNAYVAATGVFREVIADLVWADNLLAAVAIEQARGMPVTDPRMEKIVAFQIARAAEAFARAQQLAQDGKPALAAGKYGSAWFHAQLAMKFAGMSWPVGSNDGKDKGNQVDKLVGWLKDKQAK